MVTCDYLWLPVVTCGKSQTGGPPGHGLVTPIHVKLAKGLRYNFPDS